MHQAIQFILINAVRMGYPLSTKGWDRHKFFPMTDLIDTFRSLRKVVKTRYCIGGVPPSNEWYYFREQSNLQYQQRRLSSSSQYLRKPNRLQCRLCPSSNRRVTIFPWCHLRKIPGTPRRLGSLSSSQMDNPAQRLSKCQPCTITHRLVEEVKRLLWCRSARQLLAYGKTWSVTLIVPTDNGRTISMIQTDYPLSQY